MNKNNDYLHKKLTDLKIRHRNLDKHLKELEENYLSPEYRNRLKTMKLWYKDEIFRLEKEIEK